MVRIMYDYILRLNSVIFSYVACQCSTRAKSFPTDFTLIRWCLWFVELLLQILRIRTKYIWNITMRPGISIHIQLSCFNWGFNSWIFCICLFRRMVKSIMNLVVNLFSWAMTSYLGRRKGINFYSFFTCFCSRIISGSGNFSSCARFSPPFTTSQSWWIWYVS